MSFCSDLAKQLTKAREEMDSHARNSLGWYKGDLLWNQTVYELGNSGNQELFKNALAPANAEMELDDPEDLLMSVVIPEFDKGQVLRRLN